MQSCFPCDKITVQTRNFTYCLHQTVLKAGGIIYVVRVFETHQLPGVEQGAVGYPCHKNSFVLIGFAVFKNPFHGGHR